MLRRVKGLVTITLAIGFFFYCTSTAMAFGHYTPGSLGLNAASLPPPGFHYTMYNLMYTADTMLDDNGNDLDLDLDLTVFANVHQFTYMTDYKILGADFGFDVLIPLVYTSMEMKRQGVDEDSFSLGDICVEPFVFAWHTPRWDVALAFGFYAPTGESDEPSSPGAGYWSFMETLGATYYFDEARTWTASLLTRWLQNTEDRDTEITAGANVVAEYGLAKAFPFNSGELFLTAGVAGYTYKQLDEDSGDGASDQKYFGNAVGPEIRLMGFKPFPFQLSLRYLFEYAGENTTEGQNVCLTLIGSF
ncbi:SphA family protein [Dethiosulfatarculus sandiegensis]|uniref:Transporter n=1 Tax=Dethiosulfatarculus sandiegensis TaxID=1429043 RepID=A0A0D2J5F1_9BACT|nr:transporter [Dethiosulfatarculus sandiegensis]KIX13349.1 hypothetical protein X474_14130 [Dethiosulfatarculus sandiegensis]